MTDSEQILAAKVAYLSGNADSDIDERMKQAVENDPALKKELAFIEAFWHCDIEDEQPSQALDARFYRMLSQAQSVQQKIDQAAPQNPSTWQRFFEWLAPRPAAQFAMMAAVFVIGYSANQTQTAPATMPADTTAMNGLQQEVRSLSSLVALSMIQNSSASKRLTGIQYSRQSADDTALTDALVKMVNEDKSTAVRLAAIDALAARHFDEKTGPALLAQIGAQSTMVQINLVALLTQHGSKSDVEKLAELVQTKALRTDAIEFFHTQTESPKHSNSI